MGTLCEPRVLGDGHELSSHRRGEQIFPVVQVFEMPCRGVSLSEVTSRPTPEIFGGLGLLCL